MPEFSAVTLVNGSAANIVGRKVRRERIYVAAVQAVRLTPFSDWTSNKPLAVLPQDHRAAASFPMVLALASQIDSMADPIWPLGKELRSRL